MKTERRTIYVTVRVDFNCPVDMEQLGAQNRAESLAIRPNFNSNVDGVSLEEVEVRFTDVIND